MSEALRNTIGFPEIFLCDLCVLCGEFVFCLLKDRLFLPDRDWASKNFDLLVSDTDVVSDKRTRRWTGSD